MEENVFVSIRARPLNEKEILTCGHYSPWTIDKERQFIVYAPAIDTLSFSSPTTASIFKSTQDQLLQINNISQFKSSEKVGTPLRSSLKSPTIVFSKQNALNSNISKRESPTKLLRSPSNSSSSSSTPTTPKLNKKSSPRKQTSYSSPSTPSNRDASRAHLYTFDYIFDPSATNFEIYNKLASKIVTSAMSGYNGTIFAYGQTSSGKTYTMKGEGKKNLGVIPLAIQDIFGCISKTPNRQFLLRVSYLEIYNEIINDLLAPENINLKIHEDKNKGVYVETKEEIVVSPEHVMSLIAAGEAHRHTGSTDYNEQSSRSHTIFRVVIESKERNSSESSPVLVSVLNLIDLAGSEKASSYDTGTFEGRRKEGSYINKSLLTLGQVISKLSEQQEGVHIPFRDSKLTRILQNSLSGNSRIGIICTISLSPLNFEETISTIKFASRAKRIVNRANLNEIIDDKTLIKKYQAEIAELKRKLEEAQLKERQLQELEKQKVKVEEEHELMSRQLQEQETIIAGLQEKIRQLTKHILDSSTVSKSSRREKKALSVSGKWIESSQEETFPSSPKVRRPSLTELPIDAKKVIETQEAFNKFQQYNFRLKEKIEHYKEELEGRDSQILFLRSAIEMLEQNIETMKAQYQERIKKVDSGPETPRSPSRKSETEIISYHQEHIEKIKELQISTQDLELELQIVKADNLHLIHQVGERDKAIKEWSDTSDQMGKTILELQEENAQLKEILQKLH